MSGTLTILMVKMACERDECALASVSLCVRLRWARASSRTASCTVARHRRRAARRGVRQSQQRGRERGAPAVVYAPRAS